VTALVQALAVTGLSRGLYQRRGVVGPDGG
jgi:hypothetical protein